MRRWRDGFTLIEIIMAIVIIGIAVPTIMIPFSGLSKSKNPEYYIQASFLAQKQMEAMSGKKMSAIPSAGTYTCATFQATVTEISCSSTGYTFSWLVEDVAANALNTAVGTTSFAKRVTLTVSHATGGDLKFYSLFVTS